MNTRRNITYFLDSFSFSMQFSLLTHEAREGAKNKIDKDKTYNHNPGQHEFSKIFKNTVSSYKKGDNERVSAQADRTAESDSQVVSSHAAEASTHCHQGDAALQGLMRPTAEATSNHHQGGAAL